MGKHGLRGPIHSLIFFSKVFRLCLKSGIINSERVTLHVTRLLCFPCGLALDSGFSVEYEREREYKIGRERGGGERERERGGGGGGVKL